MTHLLFAWALTIACLNWIRWKLTGWPVAYCVGRHAATPILPFMPMVNLALTAFMLFRLVREGLWAGVQVAGVLIGLAVFPDILRATFQLGGGCG